jgi:AmiR/NasT family two-component response regulator
LSVLRRDNGAAGNGAPQIHLPRPQSADEALAQVVRLQELVGRLLVENQQLQTALESRIVIEQAKGVLAERLGVDPTEAFRLLRRAARNNRMPIHKLAAGVVVSRDTPAEMSLPIAQAPPP